MVVALLPAALLPVALLHSSRPSSQLMLHSSRPSSQLTLVVGATSRHCRPLLSLPQDEEEVKEQRRAAEKTEDFFDLSASKEDFDAGVEYGKGIAGRFFSPVIDDPGLPYADSLVVICGTLSFAILVLSGTLPVPRPGWLTLSLIHI